MERYAKLSLDVKEGRKARVADRPQAQNLTPDEVPLGVVLGIRGGRSGRVGRGRRHRVDFQVQRTPDRQQFRSLTALREQPFREVERRVRVRILHEWPVGQGRRVGTIGGAHALAEPRRVRRGGDAVVVAGLVADLKDAAGSVAGSNDHRLRCHRGRRPTVVGSVSVAVPVLVGRVGGRGVVNVESTELHWNLSLRGPWRTWQDQQRRDGRCDLHRVLHGSSRRAWALGEDARAATQQGERRILALLDEGTDRRVLVQGRPARHRLQLDLGDLDQADAPVALALDLLGRGGAGDRGPDHNSVVARRQPLGRRGSSLTRPRPRPIQAVTALAGTRRAVGAAKGVQRPFDLLAGAWPEDVEPAAGRVQVVTAREEQSAPRA